MGARGMRGARERLLSRMPVTERRLDLGGISTPVLEGGDGPPVVLLHGPFGYAAHWMNLIPGLVTSHRVIAPDLPGHGASEVRDGALTADRVIVWLAELVKRTCGSSPAIVGQTLGGAIAARFAIAHGSELSRLVLADSLGLRAFQPAPEFGQALTAFLSQPVSSTHEALWRHCAFDLPSLQQRMRPVWEAFEEYNLDRARTPAVQAAAGTLMELFGFPAIPPADLDRISVPTALIWGRHDHATPLSVAEGAGSLHKWPLHVIDDASNDPPIDQPEAFLRALRQSLATSDARPIGRTA